MNDNQSERLMNILEEAMAPYKKYVRDLRWQSWGKTFLFVLLFIEAISFLRVMNKVKNKEERNSPPAVAADQGIGIDYLDKSLKSDDVVVVVPIDGVISEGGKDGNMAKDVKNMLSSARKNPRVKAVILKVESPGGTVNASNLIWNEIMKFKKSGKPVVAFFNGMAASGGYYISAPADKIVATPETLTGSIGVIMQIPNYSKLLDKVGVSFNTVKSGARKDMLSPYKPSDEEDRKIAQSLVDGAFNRFVKKVADGRKIKEGDVRVLADGRIYDAEQALGIKLIDRIGYIEDAFKEAKTLAKLNDASLARYYRKKNIFDEFFSAIGNRSLINVEQPVSMQAPGLYYLWTGN